MYLKSRHRTRVIQKRQTRGLTNESYLKFGFVTYKNFINIKNGVFEKRLKNVAIV